jgi:putative membrane protein insertion efficiency factor
MKTILSFLIKLYQATLSPWIGGCCRFYPSCSDYGLEVLAKHGAWKGTYLLIKRLLKCHPFNPGGLDPPPE